MKRKLATLISLAVAGSMIFSVPVMAEKEEKTKLTLWHIQTGTMASCLDNSAQRFMEENPQYEVEVIQMQKCDVKSRNELLTVSYPI
ncbi:MAG: hypothetical protein Q4D16_26050, partial [Eubacteriales bacterium]|nr:hypothetical protein [Eubacteriales bacterium]